MNLESSPICGLSKMYGNFVKCLNVFAMYCNYTLLQEFLLIDGVFSFQAQFVQKAQQKVRAGLTRRMVFLQEPGSTHQYKALHETSEYCYRV